MVARPLAASDSLLSDSDSASNSSFRTAVEDYQTQASSPEVAATPPYRHARGLPNQLHIKCHNDLDEQRFPQAIAIFSSLLVPDSVRNGLPSRSLAYVPPAAHLALLATLVVHPDFTTCPRNNDHTDVPALAIRYLRTLLDVAGPINGRFKEVLHFSTARKTRRLCDTIDSLDDETDDDGLTCIFANQQSLWHRGHDFWYVLGWALNCSYNYPHRWRTWRPWLELILDVLERDWDERERLDHDADSKYFNLQESIIVAFLSSRHVASRNGLKFVMKSIFANASPDAASSFGPIFHDETKELSTHTSSKKRKRSETLDLENDTLGDWDPSDQSSDDDIPISPMVLRSGKRSSRRVVTKPIEPIPTEPSPEVLESVSIRLRVFSLISRALSTLPDVFKDLGAVDDLYDSFCSNIHYLPLPVFAHYMNHTSTPLLAPQLCSTAFILLENMLPEKAKRPNKVDKEAASTSTITQPILEECFLPYAATSASAEDNAKISLLVELLFQALLLHNEIEYSPKLRQAVETGIEARYSKVNRLRSRKASIGQQTLGRSYLVTSSDRLKVLIQIAETCKPTSNPNLSGMENSGN